MFFGSAILISSSRHCLDGLTRKEAARLIRLFLLIAQSREDSPTDSAGQDDSITLPTFLSRGSSLSYLSRPVYRRVFLNRCQDAAAILQELNRLALIVINRFYSYRFIAATKRFVVIRLSRERGGGREMMQQGFVPDHDILLPILSEIGLLARGKAQLYSAARNIKH